MRGCLRPFEEGRHARRMEKLAQLERQLFGDEPEAILKSLGVGNTLASRNNW